METKAALLTNGFEAQQAGQEQQAFARESARSRAGSSPAPPRSLPSDAGVDSMS